MSTTDELLRLPDLANRRIGGSVIAANDEFFAERENLIKPDDPVYRPHTFTNKGQEYDGWETRRRRHGDDATEGVGAGDRAIVRLGAPGVVRAVVVDTSHFVGNFPPEVTVEGCGVEGYPDPGELAGAAWEPVVDRSEVKGDTRNVFPVNLDRRFTHVRLTMHPDGGVARLRVHGEAVADPRWFADVPTDLIALANGGAVVGCSDWFFSPPHHMLQPGESRYMSDGWETRRRRDDGHDWAVLRLFATGVPRVAEVDTTHYKGNSPDAVSLSATAAAEPDPDDPRQWFELLPETRLQPDASHRFRLPGDRPLTHVRLDVYPDGGVGRLRLYGGLTEEGSVVAVRRWFDTLPPEQARAVLVARAQLPAAVAALLPER